MSSEKKISSYLNFLPAIYQRDPGITNTLLLACERMLSGKAEFPLGIEGILDNIHRYFNPETTPQAFLEWLAGWMALDLIKGKEWDDPDYLTHLRMIRSEFDTLCKEQKNSSKTITEWLTADINDCRYWESANRRLIDSILEEINEFNKPEKLETGREETILFLNSKIDKIIENAVSSKEEIVSSKTDETVTSHIGKVQHLPHRVSSRNRMLIRKLIPLFNIRGTRKGFEEILKVYLEYMDCTFIINELLNPFQIGGRGSAPSDRALLIWNHATNQKDTQPVNDVTLRELINLGNNGHLTSVIGSSSVVGEGTPYYFRVTIDTIVPVRPTDLQKKKKMIMPIIDKEKPAHTYYSIRISAPGMQIGQIDNVDGKSVRKYHCTIGEDNLIGGLTI